MMKHILTALVLVTSFSFSVAQAAGTIIANSQATIAQCPLLNGDTPLNTSKGVRAAINCIEAENSISFATCHENGSRATKTYTCALIQGTEAEGNAVYNDTSCNASNVGTATFEIIADYKAFAVGNKGGSVGPVALKGACDEGKLTAVLK